MSDTTIRILLADDDKGSLTVYGKYLQECGYTVRTAENGREALKLIEDEVPDVMVTDLRMPLVGGLQLLQELKEQQEFPVLILSGAGKMDDVIEALRLGASDYLMKPIHNLAILHHRIELALETSQLRKKERLRKIELEDEVYNQTKELRQQNLILETEIEKRKQQEALVDEARREWERTFDAMPDMIALIDNNCCTIRMNKTLRDLLGISAEDVLGAPCVFLPQGKNRSDCPHKEIQKGKKIYRYERYDEKLGGHVEITVIPYLEKDGKSKGTIQIARNINLQKEAEEEREVMQTRMLQSQKLESVGQLASGIAHEINTPTQYIGSNVEFIGESFEDARTIIDRFISLMKTCRAAELEPREVADMESLLQEVDWEYLKEEVPAAIQQAKEGITRVSSIVRAMKEFSHPGSKSLELVDLNSIIESTVTVSRNEWKYVSEIDLDLGNGLEKVPCLSDEVGQVLLNMLVNAAHAIEEKLGKNPDIEKGRIVIKTRRISDHAQIEISDSGNGIPQRMLDRIFDPFFTTKGVGQGTGQGLAISHDVITRKHNGSIKVESAEGEGTTFTLLLPLTPEAIEKR